MIPLWLQRFLLQVLLNKVFGPNRLQMKAKIDSKGAIQSFTAIVAAPVVPYIPPLVSDAPVEPEVKAEKPINKVVPGAVSPVKKVK